MQSINKHNSMRVYTVTITGADDSTDQKELVKLSEFYPFVEWGILLSKSRQGTERFPSIDWIKELHSYSSSVRLSGHMCGSWMKDVLKGKLSLREEQPEIWDMFKRIQLNFAKTVVESYEGLLDALSYMHDKQVIFQLEGVNNNLFYDAKDKGLNIAPLFDCSCGNGVQPIEWPLAIDGFRCGYAGGLGPDNIRTELEKISKVANTSEIWIDMESKVRSKSELSNGIVKTELDLDKVERVLDAIEESVPSAVRAQTFLQTGDGQKKISDSLRPPKFAG